MTTTMELLTFTARSTGHNAGAVYVIGPVQGRLLGHFRDDGKSDTYSLELGGRHQCGGFLWHLSEDLDDLGLFEHMLTDVQVLSRAPRRPTKDNVRFVEQRRHTALGYLWGAEDYGAPRSDATEFAEFAAAQALAYTLEQTCSLRSVQDQYKEWLER